MHRVTMVANAAWGGAWHAGIAGLYVFTWFNPEALDPRMVHKLTFLMMIEFLAVHSAGMLVAAGIIPRKIHRALALAGLMLFYVLLALGFSAGYGGPWPLYGFLILAMPRLPGLVMNGLEPVDMGLAIGQWAAMTFLFLVAVFSTLIFTPPAFGITAEVIANQEFAMEGLWPEEPYRVVAAGAIYFSGMTLVSVILAYLSSLPEFAQKTKRRVTFPMPKA